MAKSSKSWQSRLSGGQDAQSADFVESLSYDKRLYEYDIRGSIAHAQMLRDVKLITKEEFSKIKNGLEDIKAEIEKGKFKFDVSQEDIHMAVESALIERIGEAGRKLHTARSRNDQVSTDMRLWLRDEIKAVRGLIRRLQKALVKQADKYKDAVMPSYTHLQRAQPIVIGAYLLSFVEQFERDYIRLGNCSELANVCPLGSGAAAGSTLRIDRQATAEKLGFDDITHNSIDSVSDRDFCAEFIFDSAMIMTHLSKFAEDWIIFSSGEFGFVTLSDKHCTSSSMMPQKKNPDMLELIRGKTGAVFGSLTAMLTVLKAQPSTYNRDLQEDKVHLFAAADTVRSCLAMAEAIAAASKFETKRIDSNIDSGYADATALAEYLVTKGVAFRKAHQIVGSLVAGCEKQNKKLGELDKEDFRKVCDKIDNDVYDHLGPHNVVSRYVTEGAGGPGQTKQRIDYWKERLKRR